MSEQSAEETMSKEVKTTPSTLRIGKRLSR